MTQPKKSSRIKKIVLYSFLAFLVLSVTYSALKKNTTKNENTESSSGKVITKEDFGARWPFTVDKGFLACTENRIVFTAAGKSYGVNGFAKSSLKGLSEIEEIWAIDSAYYDPKVPGSPIRISIGPILDAGKALCK